MDHSLQRAFVALLLLATMPFAPFATAAGPGEPRWWKGNLHTHSLWSDGDDYPEMVTEWYKDHGYHFLGLSDHNIMMVGDKWIAVTNNRNGEAALRKYLDRFGPAWVRQRVQDGTNQVRLRTLEEFRYDFEEPGRFLLIPAEEITAHYDIFQVHLIATNLRELILPRGGEDVLAVLQNNLNALLQQRQKTGQPMMIHVAHPNYSWAITAEDLMRLRGERFFEVYNGHPAVNNYGGKWHASTERIWDIALTWRLAELGLEPLFGLAVDDSHNYHQTIITNSNPGRGWVEVRATQLNAASLIAAMEAGDFYASTGVRLKEIQRGPDAYSVSIEPESHVTFTIQFIGTKRNFERASEPMVPGLDYPYPTTRRYSGEIGAVLAETKGTTATYKLKGEELYVRAKIISSKLKSNPYALKEPEVAWTQPLVPAAR